jgi:AcrR family transcriptional regulator
MSSLNARDTILQKLRPVFLDHGYEHITMAGIAEAAGIPRRTLYHYFSSKEQAFRAVIAHGIQHDINRGKLAAATARAAEAGVLEILVAFFDARFGVTRCELSNSPHAGEISEQVSRSCRDIMIDMAVAGQLRLVEILQGLADGGLLHWQAGCSPYLLAQLLFDAARGINQSLPPRPSVSLTDLYREHFAVLLRGATAETSDLV